MVAIHNKFRQGETQHSKSSIEPNQPPLTNLVMDGPFSQQLSIMHSLSSRQDLLSPHKHVVRIGVFLVEKKKKTNYILASQPQNINPKFRNKPLNRSSQTGHRSNKDIYLLLMLFTFIINESYIQILDEHQCCGLFSCLYRSSSTTRTISEDLCYARFLLVSPLH